MSNSLQLQCVARGLGSVDEMGQTVLRDDTVQFCLVRLPLGSGTFARVKLVHIMNIGPRCSAVQRGRLTSQLSSVLKRFGATSAGMEIHSAQEASFDYMLNKLGKVLVADYTEAGTSPSALREQYLQNIRAAAEAAAQQEAWLERKASREELSRLRNGPLAGSSSGKFTPHEVPNPVDSVNSPATHESQHEDVPQTVDVMRSTAATVELISASASPTATARRPSPPMPGVDPSTPLGQKGLTPNFLLKSLRDDCGEYNWCMHFVKTDEAFSMKDDMVDGGRGGLEELCNILRDPDICDDKIAVGLLRMSFGSGRFRRVKFVFYHYMGGDNVSSMARAKVNAKIPEIMKQLKPFTLEIRIQNSDEAVPRFFFHSLQDKLVSDNIVSDTDTSLFRKNRNKKTTPAAKSEDTVPEAPDPEVSSSIEAEASNQPTTTKEPQRGEANTMAELLELEYRRALEEEQAMHAERRQAVCAEEEQQAEEERDTVSEELKTPDEESNPETTSTAVEAPPQTEREPSRDPPQETPSLQVFDADSTIALLRSESMNAPYTWAVFEFLKK